MFEEIIPSETISEVLSDIEGVECLEHDHGDRFRGWYIVKTPEGSQTLPLGHGDQTHCFPVSDFRFKFIMPPVLTFSKGSIYYRNGERKLGVFRFPQNAKGEFTAPIPLDPKKLMELSEDQIIDLIKDRKVLLFEAFRIPQFGFSLFDPTPEDLESIRVKTDHEYFEGFKNRYGFQYSKMVDAVKDKILSLPNYLLILLSILDLQQKDISEVAKITDNIITNET